MKIIRRIPCEQYAYWEIEFDSSEELKKYPEIKKTLKAYDMTPEKRFEEELGEPKTRRDDTEKSGDGIFKR